MRNEVPGTAAKKPGLSRELRDQLAHLTVDCWDVTGTPFDHFLCPLLLSDEETELCKAHIVNQAFNDAPGVWTVQRKDVDNFFGSVAEAAFTILQDARDGSQFDQITDPRKRRRLKTTLLVDGRPVGHYLPRGPVPSQFTLVGFDDGASRIPIAIKMSEDDLAAALDANWQIGIECDLRYPALVSLIKAGFLTMFLFFGYRYALSPAGRSVGADLLGAFFSTFRGDPVGKVVARIPEIFGPLQAMVRPVISTALPYKGTLVDGRMLLCWEEQGFPWAAIVFVPGAGMHSIMMPLQADHNALERYQRFIADGVEEIVVREAIFHRGRSGRWWDVSPKAVPIQWPHSEAA